MSNFRSKMIITCILGCLIAVVSAIPVLSYAQQQTDFSATLSGKNVSPPVNTPATGIAKFHLNPNGTLSYQVDVNNINGAIGVPIRLKSGVDLAELLNVYQTVNQKAFTQSLGVTNGVLAKGVITAANLLGPLIGNHSATDLIPFFTNKSANVIVRTQGNQMGEIEGQIVPGAAPAATPAASTNATTSAANKTTLATAPPASQAPAATPSAGMNSSAPAAPVPSAGMNSSAPAAPVPSAGMNSSAPPAAVGMNKTGGMGVTSLGNMMCHYIPQSKSLLCHMA
jgi:CHRD domain